jgi:hypothetical protein
MKKRYKILVFFLLLSFISIGQQTKKAYKIHTIAFYNLENLYDTIDDPKTKDEYSPILKMNLDKSKAYVSKIENMAEVLAEIGKETTQTSPSIIGLAEVENSAVLDDLIKSDFLKKEGYDYIHMDSEDWRGIDVTLLYKKGVFEPVAYKSFQLKAFNHEGYRIKTRDQLLVSGYLENELIHVIVNHWPSRLSGKQKTAHLREETAKLNLKIIQEVRIENPNSKIISLGDFNDNPTDTSIKEILKTSDSKENTEKDRLYNPFDKLYKKGFGSLGYQNRLHLFDQIIVSENWIAKNQDYSSLSFYKAGIYNPSYLTNKKGKYKGYPFRSWSNNNEFTGGYSDHYPVYMFVLREK